MKIGVENLSLKDSHFDRDKKVNKVSVSGNKDLSGTEIKIQNTNSEIKNTYVQLQRSISRAQTKLNGFMLVRERIEDNNQYSEEENLLYLKDLLNNTQLKEERLLQAYESELTNILQESSNEKITALITNIENEINEYVAQIDNIDQAKNSTAKQNLLAAKSSIEKSDLDSLMQNVVTQLKESNLPGINVAREKIIDLL